MKKILYILHFPPPTHGAAMVGKYIMDSELLKTSFQSRYINLGTSRTIEEIGDGGIKKFIRFLGLFVRIIKNLITYRPDLVYFTPSAVPIGFYKDCLLAVLVKLLGGRVVYHFHNKGVALYKHKKLENFLYKVFFKNASVILLSKSLFDDVKGYVEQDRVFYCANGIPELATDYFYRSEKKDSKEKVELLFLSNLIKAKGVMVLLEALAILKQERSNFRCSFVGGSGDISVDELSRKIQELDLQDFAFYLGGKYEDEKYQTYADADIFVFPTYNETFGLVNLEAMQFSLPVVSTYEGGIPDVVLEGETGFLVEPKKAKELAVKLKMLIDNEPLRVYMGNAGKERYQKKFTLVAFEKNMKRILEQLAA